VLPRLFRGNVGVRMGVAVTFLVITGHFVAYTYLRPVVREISAVDANLISLLLLVFGVAALGGDFVAGWTVSRNVRGTLLGAAVLLASAVVLTALVGEGAAVAVVLLSLWGIAYGGVPVSLQTWILKAAPKATEAPLRFTSPYSTGPSHWEPCSAALRSIASASPACCGSRAHLSSSPR
jgi:predicted MFS family arabinose efflux permease